MSLFIDTPLFGIILSIVAYEIGIFITKKTNISLIHPYPISAILIMIFLYKFNISFKTFNKGGELITFFLTPTTVILAIPLYKQIHLLKKNAIPILAGITAGCATSIVSVLALAKLFKLPEAIGISIVPRSITTPMGIELSKIIGGIPSVTVTTIIFTGNLGVIIAPYVLKLFRIKDKVAIGAAIGTGAHAIGTAKALEIGETEGAISSLSVGLAGIITTIITSFIF
jgi:predicted murein hydrolase (TIGR00659 family)